jgi:tyrosinase
LMYERTVRALTGFNDFALPYWDWTSERQLPPAFTAAGPNPLLEPSRDMGANDSLPDENVGSDVITQIMGETPFEAFGTTRPGGQDSTDQKWITRTTGDQGTLEGNPHNAVHGIVGGLMASAASPLDPIFMMHHCNIDRLWWVWNGRGNANSNDPFWTDMEFKNHFFNPDGSPYSPKVSDLYTPETLGYTYDLGLATLTPSTPSPATPTPVDDKLRVIFSTPNLADVRVAGVSTFVAANSSELIAAPNKPWELPVEVAPNPVITVARYRRPSAGAEVLDPNQARAQIARGPRALCFIRDIAVTKDQNTQYRVFIECDYLSSATPITDRHYVGTFSFFGDHGHDHGPGRNPSVLIDLTRPLQRVFGSAPEGPKTLRVQMLPVSRGQKGEVGTAKPSRVEIVIVTP